ncbi:hypothetical protein BDN70DRAFT_893720 [Pholiota conissans]|uniref:Uncharacterized protein n=1 Tax=Pholiota conissans TaxID=109636 RepID=A0A9P5Z4W5_9AGAR|nr:hypothetical protein BDN70DRAFT_893720 [Pholiota conissans]
MTWKRKGKRKYLFVTPVTCQKPAPIINIIPNTPAKPFLMAASQQGPGPEHSPDVSFLQPNKSHYNFRINNPLAGCSNTFTVDGSPLTEQIMPVVPAISQLLEQQTFKMNNSQPIVGNCSADHPVQNDPIAPAKRSRTGATKMRPSKTSTTPRNLCALEWAILNPKGTTDAFSAYYDALSAEGKEKWEKLSVEAKKSGKMANPPHSCSSQNSTYFDLSLAIFQHDDPDRDIFINF